ncbi:hypothetical protein EFS30_09125, partial [Levilactobacillus parabrevis]|nr:hypothetical protein [Levilactobacillus parabrevis]
MNRIWHRLVVLRDDGAVPFLIAEFVVNNGEQQPLIGKHLITDRIEIQTKKKMASSVFEDAIFFP